jgi:maltooligosyltrehalose trehalohydrolase
VSRRFRVWAPRPTTVELMLPGERLEMTRHDDGWWSRDVDHAGPGYDYGYSLDGGPPRPDPRSAWQPAGVDGPSRVLDHSAFVWSDRGWRGVYLPSAVLYELHVGTFTPEGTFDAVVSRLDHLVALGIDAIELLPVAEFSGDRGWGYDGVDLFAPHHCYGGPDGLKRLVDACHARGVGVVMDVVYNHLGPAGNYLSEFGPYFTDRHATNWGDAVNFDGPDSTEVRSFVVDNALMWLRDYHCDGLRLDAVHAIVDTSALPILEQLGAAVDELAGHARRPLFVIAESDLNDPKFVRGRAVDGGGYGLDAVWADEFHHALHAVLTGETIGYYQDFGTLELLAKALRQAWVYAGDYSPFRRRIHGRPPVGLGGERFVVFLQNHDQVGNRATGDRITDSVPIGRAMIGAALVLLGSFVPLLFQGEEWAASTPFRYFTDHQDPELGAAVSNGRRREFSSFGWSPEQVPDPQDPETFLASKLQWGEQSSAPHVLMLDWYRSLISLRRNIPTLTDGRQDRVRTSFDEERRWLVVERAPITIAANFDGEMVALPIDGRNELVAASHQGIRFESGQVDLPPDSVAVLIG